MAGTFRNRVQSYVRARQRGPAPPKGPSAALRLQRMERSQRSPEQALGHRLASEPQVLERLVVVQPHTVAVVVPSDQRPLVKRPGEQLRPSVLSSKRTYVVVVSTAVTRLDLTLDHLLVLGREQPLERVTIRVGVQVVDRDDYKELVNAELLNHTDLDAYLVGCVERELAKRVRDGMTLNRLADLQPATLERVLADRWVPPTFAGGVLARKSFSVLEVVAAPESPGRGLYAVPDRGGFGSDDTEPTLVLPGETDLDLSMDAGLRRRWRRHVDLELLGIAGAKVEDRATVIAVPVRDPSTHEGTILREAFRDYFADRHVRLVSAVGRTYTDLVRAWFRQVDSWPQRVVAVADEDEAVLRVHVDQRRLAPEDRAAGVSVGRESDREALERLLPHQRVEFVPADLA